MNNTNNIWGILLFCGVSLLICSCTSYVYVSSYSGGNISSQGLISSLRITIEIILYIIIFSKISRRLLIRTLVLLGYVNSSLVAVEFAERLFHTGSYGTFGITQTLAGFWSYYSEYSRFAGLFNSYASSSYFTCLVISIFMMDSKARADSDIMRLLKMITYQFPFSLITYINSYCYSIHGLSITSRMDLSLFICFKASIKHKILRLDSIHGIDYKFY